MTTPQSLPVLKFAPKPRWPGLPRFSVLDRYVLQELYKPFLFGVGIFSAVGVSAGSLFTLLQQVTATQIPLDIALKVLALQIPRFVSFALPMAMLLASLLCMARLSSDRELTAMRACGVSLYRLLVPIVLFGLTIMGLMFGLNETIVPFTQYEAKVRMQQPLLEGRLNLEDKNVFFQEYGPDREIRRFFYAQTFDGQSMRSLTIVDLTQPKVNQVIAAEKAAWDPKDSRWQFQNGKIYRVSVDGSDQSVAAFKDQQLYVPRDPLNLAVPRQSLDDMSIADARDYLEQQRQAGNVRQQLKATLHIQRQLALPVVTVLFGVIGSLLGTSLRRISNSTGFGICILIVLGYYFLGFLTNSLGNLGLLSPGAAAWFPNLSVAGVAGWLLLRLQR